MLRAVYGGRTVWTGEAHKIGVSEVELTASKAAPPIPGGAALFCDCPEEDNRFMGYVREILPTKMERWLLKLGGADAAVEKRGAVDPGAALWDGSPGADEAGGAVASPAEFHGGLPLSALRELSTTRTWAALEDLPLTVEELNALTDAEILELDGIGPKSLLEIRAAIAQAFGRDA